MTAVLENSATPDATPEVGAVPSFDVTLRIRRFNPEADEAEAYWEEFTVTAYGTDRVLDAMHKIKWEVDGSLTFRRSCAHGICGSDAMRINGRNRLACKVLLKDLDPSKPITIEPIKGLPVVKDLVVDMEPFFASYREIMPFLITSGNAPSAERLQSAEQRERYDDTTKCILCAACTSSCPVFWNDGQYFGPAAIVNAHRFIFDSRDEGAEQRLEILNDKEGVWRCRTVFNCTEACPRGIEVTKAIQEVKRAMITRAFGHAQDDDGDGAARPRPRRRPDGRPGSGLGGEREGPHRTPHAVVPVLVDLDAVDLEGRVEVRQVVEGAVERVVRDVVGDRDVRVVVEAEVLREGPCPDRALEDLALGDPLHDLDEDHGRDRTERARPPQVDRERGVPLADVGQVVPDHLELLRVQHGGP